MLDIRWIRDNPGALDAALSSRGHEPREGEVLRLDDLRRSLVADSEARKARLNALARETGAAMARKDVQEAERLKAESAALKAAGDAEPSEAQCLQAAQATLDRLLASLPNVPAAEVPPGADEEANVELRRVGTPPVLGFEPLDHVALGERLGLDVEAATRMSGTRFALMRGQVARLERALGQFMLDLHVTEHGYEEAAPPLLVREEAVYGTAQLPKFADDLFKTTDGRWLIPTAEVPLTNVVRESLLVEADLPLRLAALTPCFRSEAGSAGRDTRGLIRQHQFWKCELVSVVTPEAAAAEHERMLACAEAVLSRLGLACRVVALCAGDMGFAARRTYDIEVWLPAQGRYREISSCSDCGDFQARRMGARLRLPTGKGTRFPHTLNGSGVAVGRRSWRCWRTTRKRTGASRSRTPCGPTWAGSRGWSRRPAHNLRGSADGVDAGLALREHAEDPVVDPFVDVLVGEGRDLPAA